jgi:hypothetical protein
MTKACILACLTAALMVFGPEAFARTVSTNALDNVVDHQDVAETHLGDALSLGVGNSGTAGGRRLMHPGHPHRPPRQG